MDVRPTYADHLEECRLMSRRLVEDNNQRAEIAKHHASVWVPAPCPPFAQSSTDL